MSSFRGYSGILLDIIKSERLVILGPIVFINFFAVGYILHGVVFTFKEMDFSQIAVSVTLSMILFFGQLVLLMIPTKVLVDHKLAPDLRKERDIIRLTFDEQDREVFKRLKIASNSFILMLTGLVNYLLIGYFMFLWYSNNGQPLPPKVVVNAITPVFGFLTIINVVAVAYDILRSKKK